MVRCREPARERAICGGLLVAGGAVGLSYPSRASQWVEALQGRESTRPPGLPVCVMSVIRTVPEEEVGIPARNGMSIMGRAPSAQVMGNVACS